MSIYIGKTPISSTWSSVSATASNSSTPMILASDHNENFIQFQNFRIGQTKENNTATFQLYHSNVLLTKYSSNLLQHTPNALFLQNIEIKSDLQIGSNLTTRTASACNVIIYMKDGIPLKILNSNADTVFQIGLDDRAYFIGNLGIGIINPTYRLEVADSMRVQSNLIIGKSLNTQNLNTNVIYGTDNPSTRIEFNENNILLTSVNTIINNPSLKGNITYGATITLNETAINQLEASNLRVTNNQTNQQGIYIQQLNPGSFANTATGNPLHIESYFATTNTNIPIFVVDTIGRISSGKTTASIPEPDYGYTYYIDKDRYPYLSGFLQFTSCNILDQMIINKQGYISIGSNQAEHPLQITNPYSGYETNIPRMDSLIGLYQTGSNQYAYLKCYDCNQNTIFQITNSGKVLFQSQPQYDSSYQLEIQKRAYIRTLDTSNILSSTGIIQFQNSDLSNIQRLDTYQIDAKSGVLSNVFFHNLSIDNLQIDAFDYVSKAPNYEEFRIIPDRFLFYGSNLVMNPNPYFFETEQVSLPDDNVRIYANGGPTRNVNVIKTIGNNQQSQVRVYNCNNALNSISRILLEANQNAYTFGVINLSTTPGAQSEAFITNNSDLTNRNRQLSIYPDGIRIGESNHFLKDGTTTIGYTTPGKRTLTIVGEAEFKNNTGQTVLFIKNNGNIGIGTDLPRTGLDFQSQTVYVSGNLGIGKLNPSYAVDVNGTVRAARILGASFNDITGGSFSNNILWTTSSINSNIYYTLGNVGIGTTDPILPFHLYSSNLNTRKIIEVSSADYNISWPPISSTFTQVVTSNIVATFTSNIIAPFMPRYPSKYLTADTITITNALYGNGIYTAKSSSIYLNVTYYNPYYAFDSTALYWISDSLSTTRYTGSTGVYAGTSTLNGINGEWIQLFCPNSFIPGKYTLSANTRLTSTIAAPNYDVVSPRSWTLLASNTTVNTWNTLQTVTDGYVGSASYTVTYHLNTTTAYDVYAIIVTTANATGGGTGGQYGQINITNLEFFENSNQRSISLGSYNTYQLIGNTSNISTILSTSYNPGSYKISMTSNYTQQPYLDLQYSFNTSTVPYTVNVTPISYIQQSDLSGLLNATNSTTFNTLSNAFINNLDTIPPLSLQLTYPTITDPILTYSITGPSTISYAPRKWILLGSSDGTSWNQIDSQDNITWTTSETKLFTLASPSTYSQYRYDFYRNNSASYAPLSIQRILAYGTLRTNTTPLLNYISYSSNVSSYNQPPNSNLSQLSISGGIVIGSNSMITNITPPNDSIIIDGFVGIGTTLPSRTLHIQGDTRIVGHTSNEGRLYVGTNLNGNIGGGIYFGGTSNDNDYDHTVIENRVYSENTEKSELLLFKGNDTNSTSNGPDRIRLRAGEIRFDVYDTYTTNRTTENNVITIDKDGLMTINNILQTTSLVTNSFIASTTSYANAVIFSPNSYDYNFLGLNTLILPPLIGCSYVIIQMWGAGGGGAGANVQGTINSGGTVLGGGGAGGGGAYGEVILPYELLANSTLTAYIGSGGTGGTYGSLNQTITGTTNSTDATAGTAGENTTLTITTNGASSFTYTWTVGGGQGGGTSTTTTAGAAGAGGTVTGTFYRSQAGGAGGAGGTTNAGGANGAALTGNGLAASGGGGGAGSPATNTTTALYYSGGNSGTASKLESYLVGSTPFAYGDKYTLDGTKITTGTNGYGYTIVSGATGGGGAWGYTGNLTNYGNGSGTSGWHGWYPGGGGGGGSTGRTIAPDNATGIYLTGGTGGTGSAGQIIITYY